MQRYTLYKKKEYKCIPFLTVVLNLTILGATHRIAAVETFVACSISNCD